MDGFAILILYLHQRLLPAIINFLSLSDEGSSPKESGCTILASLPLFEIVLAASIVLHHQCYAALCYIATPVLYCNLRCVAEIFCRLNGKTISVLGNILRFSLYKRDIVKYI